jgi:hypothetical protein
MTRQQNDRRKSPTGFCSISVSVVVVTGPDPLPAPRSVMQARRRALMELFPLRHIPVGDITPCMPDFPIGLLCGVISKWA